MESSVDRHLASIQRLGDREAGGLLAPSSLVRHNAAMLGWQLGWLLLIGIGVLLLDPPESGRSVSDPSLMNFMAGLMCCLGATWACMQIALVFIYPEWPLNRLLCERLIGRVALRENSIVHIDETTRVVELVPRKRWSKLSMETATDLMALHIDEQGIRMEGDRYRYSLPAESILGAELYSITPTGWATSTHLVVVYVRTVDGPTELPISYRDLWWGALRNSKRRVQANELRDEVARIAKGHRYQSPQAMTGRKVIHRSPRSLSNPYAPPAVLSE